jgi:MraZ protein
VPWPKGCLRLYTEKEFKNLASRHAATLTPGEEESELELQLFGLAERIEIDSAGRIALPRKHLELTGLKGEVVIVGALNRLEIWDRASWDSKLEERFNALPHLVARIEAKKSGRPAGS